MKHGDKTRKKEQSINELWYSFKQPNTHMYSLLYLSYISTNKAVKNPQDLIYDDGTGVTENKYMQDQLPLGF